MHDCLVGLHDFHNVGVAIHLSLFQDTLLKFIVFLSRLIGLLLLVLLWEYHQPELSICKLQVYRNLFIFVKLSIVFLLVQ